jgi:excisionase family DNA binding protein
MRRALRTTSNSNDQLAPATEKRGSLAPSVLLTSEELAQRLSVPPTWVREKTRERARLRDSDPLPVVRLGKYVRFDPEAVDAWIARQST